MTLVAFRSLLRLVALMAALGCGWLAIATEQKAPTVAMAFAVLVAVASALVAVSARHGSILADRRRSAVDARV